MNHYNNLININPSGVSDDICDQIIEFYNQNLDSIKDSELVSQGVDKSSRKSFELEIGWENKLMHDIIAEIDNLIVDYLQCYPEVGRTFSESYYECGHILKYETDDGFYKYHYDKDGLGIHDRVLSIIIYLNDVESGGETEFKYFDPKIVKPKKGTVLIFPSDWTHTHRGNSPKSNEKMICVVWLRRRS